MSNNYEIATIIELGNAQDMVLGEKRIVEEWEFPTLELGGGTSPNSMIRHLEMRISEEEGIQ